MRAWFGAVVIAAAAADLPIHCLQHDVLGRWTFSLSPPHASAQDVRTKCALPPDEEAESAL